MRLVLAGVFAVVFAAGCGGEDDGDDSGSGKTPGGADAGVADSISGSPAAGQVDGREWKFVAGRVRTVARTGEDRFAFELMASLPKDLMGPGTVGPCESRLPGDDDRAILFSTQPVAGTHPLGRDGQGIIRTLTFSYRKDATYQNHATDKGVVVIDSVGDVEVAGRLKATYKDETVNGTFKATVCRD